HGETTRWHHNQFRTYRTRLPIHQSVLEGLAGSGSLCQCWITPSLRFNALALLLGLPAGVLLGSTFGLLFNFAPALLLCSPFRFLLGLAAGILLRCFSCRFGSLLRFYLCGASVSPRVDPADLISKQCAADDQGRCTKAGRNVQTEMSPVTEA